MKFLTITAAFALLFLRVNSSECGQGKVPSTHNICIEPNYIQGCSQYESQQKCGQCEQGYKLSKNTCNALQFVDRLPKILGCLKRNQSGQTCLNCANGWLKRNGKCLQAVKNCQTYSQQQKSQLSCKKCKQDYSLVLGECRYNTLVGCKKITKDHVCSQCYEPFIHNGLYCQVPHCQTLNDYGCITCQCGYYLTKDRSCKQVQNGCLAYERGICKQCLQHYKLKGGICQIQGCVKYSGNSCRECKDKYVQDDGVCTFKNCKDWINDQCLVCQNGYMNQKGLCIKQDQIVCTD